MEQRATLCRSLTAKHSFPWGCASLVAGFVVMLAWPGGTASAQAMSCIVSSALPGVPGIRSEGITERVPDILLTCTGGTPTGLGVPVPPTNIQMSVNTNITSRLKGGGLSEVFLLVDDPSQANQRPCSPPACSALGTGTGLDYNAGGGSGPPNIFPGYIDASNVTWEGLPIDPPVTGASRVLRITNVRANVALLSGPNPAVKVTQVLMSTPTGSIPVTNPQPNLGVPRGGLSLAGDRAIHSRCVTADFPFLDLVRSNYSLPVTSHRWRIEAGAAFGFKTRSLFQPQHPDDPPLPQDQPNPGVFAHGTETGFSNSVFPGSMGTSGQADRGTQVEVAISGVPSGVLVFLPNVVTLVDGYGKPTGLARRVEETSPGGAGAFVPYGPASEWSSVSLLGGIGVAFYEIITSNGTVPQQLELAIVPRYGLNQQAGLPGVGTASVTVRFAPVSSVEVASASERIPRFSPDFPPVPAQAFTIQQCSNPALEMTVGGKSGPKSARQWNIDVYNPGFQINGGTVLEPTLTQTSGPPCNPTVLTPGQTLTGSIEPGAFYRWAHQIDFSSCDPQARFRLSSPALSNVLDNQFP